MENPVFTHKRKRSIKVRLWHEQKGLCYICRQELSTDRKKHNFAEIEHVVPLSAMMGLNQLKNNIKLACRSCNRQKSDKRGVARVKASSGP